MTLQEAKDQVAKEHGFESWWHVLSKRLYRLEEVDGLITEAAELYASAKLKEEKAGSLMLVSEINDLLHEIDRIKAALN